MRERSTLLNVQILKHFTKKGKRGFVIVFKSKNYVEVKLHILNYEKRECEMLKLAFPKLDLTKEQAEIYCEMFQQLASSKNYNV